MQKTQAANVVCPAQIRIGTRGSNLAVAQATEVKNRLLGAYPELTQSQIEIIKITTTGDKIQDRHLAEIGGKGLFTKELEEQLHSGEIDIAVHSMKDMPAELPEGMVIDCILEREDPREAFLSPVAATIDALPKDATIGTSSVRRQAQLLSLRPDLTIMPFRGNVLTRLRKLEEGVVDATLLAVAGLKRLDLTQRITCCVPPDTMLPAVAQGAIGVECLESNTHILRVLANIDHEPSHVCVRAERAFLTAMGGSCTTPIGCLAELSDTGTLSLRAMIAATDGSVCYTATREGTAEDAATLGTDAGEELHHKGKDILEWYSE